MDNLAAYKKNVPIRAKKDMDRELITEPMSKDWINNIKDRWWYTENYEDCMPSELYKPRNILLSFGGEQTCLPDSILICITSFEEVSYGLATALF